MTSQEWWQFLLDLSLQLSLSFLTFEQRKPPCCVLSPEKKKGMVERERRGFSPFPLHLCCWQRWHYMSLQQVWVWVWVRAHVCVHMCTWLVWKPSLSSVSPLSVFTADGRRQGSGRLSLMKYEMLGACWNYGRFLQLNLPLHSLDCWDRKGIHHTNLMWNMKTGWVVFISEHPLLWCEVKWSDIWLPALVIL